MDKKILFFDIDGTILSHRTYQISDSTKKAIQKAQSNGHLAVINTGRSMSFIDNAVRAIGFDGYICGCGTYISYQGKELLQKTMSSDLIQSLIKDLKELEIEAALEGTRKIYYNKSSTSPIIQSLLEYQQKQLFEIGSWEDPDIEIDKFCIWTQTKESEQMFYNKYQEHFDFIDRRDNFFEIIPKGYSKASGIEYLINDLGISFEHTYAFGDGENDLPMLNYAKYSIAMGNAPQSIKDIVTFVTEDVDQDGVAHALRHFGLI